MGLFSFVGGLLGAGSAKKASRKAERAQLEYLNKALDEQRRQYDQNRTDFSPYLSTGTEALGGLSDLIGLGDPEAQAGAIAQLQESPLYQSLIRNGEEGLLQTAAATGGLRGGNMQRGLADFRADTLAQVIQNQLANLGGLSNMGLGATNSIGSLGAQSANNISNLFSQQGQVRAGGLLTRGGINARNWQNAGGFLDSAVSAALGGGGGGGGGIGGFLKGLF